MFDGEAVLGVDGGFRGLMVVEELSGGGGSVW